jgi:signal transduction histidine kinase
VRVEPEEPAQPYLAKGTRKDVTDRLPRPDDVTERVALIAHDLKTPLSIIMLEAQLLEERLSAVQSAAIQRSLERIGQNAAYIDRLIADMIDLAAVEDDALQLRLERVDLAGVLRRTLERAVSSMDRSRVQLELRCAPAVRGDENRLERVIANFVSNALKYSAQPVTVVCDVIAGRARVTVIDRGRGLTTEQTNTVFDRYRRETTRRDGHGLGLYISRKIIDAHGGEIGVTTAPDAGCQFFFELATIE